MLAGEIDLRYLSADQQVADIFIKALPIDRFDYFRLCLDIKDIHINLKEKESIDMNCAS